MNIISVLVPIIAGIIGGNVAGKNLKNFDLGTVGNSLVGLIGGAGGAAILGALSGSPETVPMVVQAGGLDMGGLLASIAGGGVGGGTLMAVVGAIKDKMQNKPRS